MGESLLKKEFKSKDVERVRNLVKKDFSAKTTAGVGYEKQYEIHNEGDVWEESGRTWTIKDGIKQNITKLDAAKKAMQMPLKCPKCEGPMKHWLAQKIKPQEKEEILALWRKRMPALGIRQPL